MKLILCVVCVVALAITFVQGYPAQKNADDNYETEIVLVPLEKQPNFNEHINNDNDFIDTGYVQPTYGQDTPYFNPFLWNFGRFFEAFESMLRRMREQASHQWTEDRISNEEAETKGNTTSTVKIIDGHKVVINDTTYVKEDQYGGQSIFKVRTIHVNPLDGDDDKTVLTTEGSVKRVTSVKDREGEDSDEEENKENRESLEDKNSPIDNDVFNRDIDDNYQFIDQQSRFEQQSQSQLYNNNNNYGQNVDDLNEFVVENHEENNNDLVNNKNDKEEESREQLSENYNVQKVIPTNNENWDTFEDFDINNSNDLDDNLPKYPSLANDIAVNQMLADQGAPHNPDAELFEVDDFTSSREDDTELRFQPIK